MLGIILIIILVVLPVLAYATTRSPETYQLDTYLWVIGLAVLGGIVSFSEKRKNSLGIFLTGTRREILAFIAINLIIFVLELFASAFSGILTFYICESRDMDRLVTAGFVGFSGFAGGRMLYFGVELVKAVLQKKFEVKVIHRSENEAD